MMYRKGLHRRAGSTQYMVSPMGHKQISYQVYGHKKQGSCLALDKCVESNDDAV